MERYGNTSAASVPIALDEMVEQDCLAGTEGAGRGLWRGPSPGGLFGVVRAVSPLRKEGLHETQRDPGTEFPLSRAVWLTSPPAGFAAAVSNAGLGPSSARAA